MIKAVVTLFLKQDGRSIIINVRNRSCPPLSSYTTLAERTTAGMITRNARGCNTAPFTVQVLDSLYKQSVRSSFLMSALTHYLIFLLLVFLAYVSSKQMIVAVLQYQAQASVNDDYDAISTARTIQTSCASLVLGSERKSGSEKRIQRRWKHGLSSGRRTRCR